MSGSNRFEELDERTAEILGQAAADYVHAEGLVDRLMASIDAREDSSDAPMPVEQRVVEKAILPLRIAAEPAERRAPSRSPRRRAAIFGFAAALSVAATVTLVILATPHREVAAPKGWSGRVAQVVRAGKDTEGGLEICAATCRPARAGDTVGEGARLKTDARTRARVELADKSEIVLDRDTELELGAAVGSPAPRAARLHHGIVVADVTHLPNAPRARFALPHASVEVVGTKFTLTASEDMSLVEVARGEVSLRDDADRSVSVGAGHEGRVLSGRAPVVARSAYGAESGDWSELAAPKTEDEPPRGIGELRAKKPGDSRERDRAVRLARHHVKVRISGNVARTEIDETFSNESGDELEGIYRMPLPPDAQIERLALEVGGKLEEGAFVARDRAKAIWGGVIQNATPQALRKVEPDIVWVPGPWKDPALLEWQRGGRFELRIFPIPAKGSRRVVLAYTQTLGLHGAARRYTYPLAYDPTGSTTIDDFDVDVQVMGHDPAFGLKPRGYAMKRPPAEDARTERLAMNARGFVPAGDFAFEYMLPNDGAELTAWTFARDGAEGYVALAIRPKLPAYVESRDRLYAIVVDSSRSMVGERWKRTVNVVSAFVRDLDRRDRFFVLACDTDCRALTEAASAPGVTAADDVRRSLSAIEPQGAHDPILAVRAALERGREGGGKKLHVVYVGDGGATAGSTKPDRIANVISADVAAREAMVTAVAIGLDADHHVLAALSRGGGGALVRDVGQNASSLASAAIAMTHGAILQRPVLKLPAGLRAVVPEALESLPEGGEMLVLARVEPGAESAHGAIELDGDVGGEKYHQSFALDARMSSSAGNAFVPRLYASVRIGELERTKGDTAKEEVVRLSREHGVASRYTSLLVLESEAMFRAFGVERNTTTTAWTGEVLAEASSAEGDEKQAYPPAPSFRPPVPTAATANAPAATPAGPVLTARKPKLQVDNADPWGPAPGTKAGADGTGTVWDGPVTPSPSLPRPRPPAEEPAPPPVTPQTVRPPVSFMQQAPPPPVRDGRGWVPMRRVFVRHGSFAAASASPRDEAGIAAAEAAFSAEPDNRTKMRALVRAHATAGRIEPAIGHLRSWLGRDALDVEAIGLHADLAARAGDRDLALRLLGSLVDLRPEDARMQLRLVRALEALGDTRRACAHRITVAESNAKDLDNLVLAVRCARTVNLGVIADDLSRGASKDVLKRIDAAPAAGTPLRGDVQIAASWEADVDLDIALVDFRGQRYSWSGAPAGVPSVRDAAAPRHEVLGLSGLPPGRYVIEITTATKRNEGVRGMLDVKVVDRTARVAFVTSGERTVIGIVTVTSMAELVPF
jgi:ferric-dicitrate binding protein FerR (iron transport regulator)